MANLPDSAQPTTPPSTSNQLLIAASSTEDEQASTFPAASDLQSSTPLNDSDDDLSDAPENPVDPSFQASSTSKSLGPDGPADSDSDLSDATSNPFWPESPKAPPSPPRCTEHDCPVRKAVRRHYQGRYLHSGEPPPTDDSMFRSSNPPPHVWESWTKIQAGDRNSTVEDDWNVLGFLRWHVENPNTGFLRI